VEHREGARLRVAQERMAPSTHSPCCTQGLPRGAQGDACLRAQPSPLASGEGPGCSARPQHTGPGAPTPPPLCAPPDCASRLCLPSCKGVQQPLAWAKGPWVYLGSLGPGQYWSSAAQGERCAAPLGTAGSAY